MNTFEHYIMANSYLISDWGLLLLLLLLFWLLPSPSSVVVVPAQASTPLELRDEGLARLGLRLMLLVLKE